VASKKHWDPTSSVLECEVEEGDMAFSFIAKQRHIWPVYRLCEVLEVSRSGFHAWLGVQSRHLVDRV
jgi:hypothetical protein